MRVIGCFSWAAAMTYLVAHYGGWEFGIPMAIIGGVVTLGAICVAADKPESSDTSVG